MPRRPNVVAGLALDLDGCRFGDPPPPPPLASSDGPSKGRRHHPVRRAEEEASSEENRHPNQRKNNDRNAAAADDDDRRARDRRGATSPLSTHHRDHRPQHSAPPPSLDGGRRDDGVPPSPMGGTYRCEGLSIGRNFLRFEGSTRSSHLSVEDLDVVECVGRGVCSSVWRARRKQRGGGAAGSNDRRDGGSGESGGGGGGDAAAAGATGRATEPESGEEDAEHCYALKVFPLRDPARRSMLVRELKLLCTFRCDCLVEMEGAFLDARDGGGGDAATLVLEFMDRGSLSDLTARDDRPGGDVLGSPKPDATPSNGRGFVLPAGPGTPALSSPLFRGLSPPTREKHRRMSERAIAAVAYQVLWGLGFLHFEGVLHRDVKPANVLVSSDGRVKLADFGIVSQRQPPPTEDDGDLEGTMASPMNHTVVGTTRYMSPERLRGMPYAWPSDVWSAGLVLLELRRGDSPFEDASSVIELVQTLDECDMSEFVPATTSEGLREILLGCLDHAPQDRMPASVLLSSPWFASHGISNVDDAAAAMKAYLECAYPPL